MSLKVVCIVQARINSVRLPRKVLLRALGKPMLWHILERIKRATRIDDIIVTSPTNDVSQIAPALPRDIQIHSWAGDEHDLIGRHLAAAIEANADLIARIPSDNFCVDPLYIDEAIHTYLDHPFVYYSNTTAECEGQMVDGIGAEVFSISRLRWLDRLTHDNPVYREHPHRYFEECGLLQLPKADVRLDVNTRTDYEFIKEIYSHFNHNRFSTQDVLGYLAASPHGQR